jgi:hypothetical protein
MTLDLASRGLHAMQSVSEEIEKFSNMSGTDAYPTEAATAFYRMLFDKIMVIGVYSRAFSRVYELYSGPKINKGKFHLPDMERLSVYVVELKQLREQLRLDLESCGILTVIQRECVETLTEISEYLGLGAKDFKKAAKKITLDKVRKASDVMDRLWTVAHVHEILQTQAKHFSPSSLLD